jgi:hypothetical protein
MRPTTRSVLFVASNLILVSYQACKEQNEHDWGSCELYDVGVDPPFLGFDYWGVIGIAFAILAAGLIVGAILEALPNESLIFEPPSD